MSLFHRKRSKGAGAPTASRDPRTPLTRVIDVSAGPPVHPPHDPALHRQRVEQEGLVDGALYDRFSFSTDVVPVGLRVVDAEIAGVIERSYRDEKDDQEVCDELIRNAEYDVARTDAEQEEVSRRVREAEEAEARERQTLVPDESAGRAWGAPERVNENRWITRGWVGGIPLVGMLVEIPWSYYALQVLGESPSATLVMAVVFGWAGVLLAHVAGMMLRRSRAGEPGRATAVVCIVCLGALALFLADIRYAFLATPATTASGTALPSGLQQFHLAGALVFAGWLAVNIGLWVAVMALAYVHYNPYVAALQRAHGETLAARRALVEAQANVPDARNALKNAQARRANCPGKWQAYRRSLAELQRELEGRYLRSLAGGKADPQFTTAVEHNVKPGSKPAPPASTNGHSLAVDGSQWMFPN